MTEHLVRVEKTVLVKLREQFPELKGLKNKQLVDVVLRKVLSEK